MTSRTAVSRNGHLFLTVVIVLTTALLASASMLTAQDKPADELQLLLEKIKADKKLLVAENMHLTETEAKAFWPLYERYQDELFLLRVRTAKLIKDYADTYEKMSDATAKRLLNEYITVEALRLKLHKAYLPRFGKILPGTKVVRYYQIENKINAALEYELATRIPLAKVDKQ
ncbi:MAG TPA: hypothetical protein VMT71_01000 [Syntrophorhabdales bacterium]|nr:hypothetical protein [Syntrophorhabdales bacterium]